MALFQKFQRNDQLVQIVHDDTAITKDDGGFAYLIVGLGNIGKKYISTRHNAGFMAIDAYREKNNFPAWEEKTKFKAFISEEFIAGGKKIILAKPTTLMNLSGEAVQAIKKFYKLTNSDITVIHDELDLPFGTIKEKQGGGSAGNNGLKSIISHIGEDFRRIRIGIKNDLLEKVDASDFVLSSFSKEEQKQLDTTIASALEKL